MFGDDAYPDLWTKAAALVQSLVKNHPLVDGNKRVAWLSTATFLELNGVSAAGAANDDVYEFVIAAAAGHDDVEQLARGLRGLCAPRR